MVDNDRERFIIVAAVLFLEGHALLGGYS